MAHVVPIRSGLGSYRQVFRQLSARSLFAGSLIGQVPVGMVTLTMLLGVAHVTGSYSSGGLVVGVYVAASGVVAPLWGRATDRLGAGRILTGMGIGFLAAFALLIVLLRAQAPLPALLPVAALAGVSRPILAGVAQSMWSYLIQDEDLLKSAYTLHSLQLGLVWVAGPLIVSALIGAFGRENGVLAALGVAALLTASGALIVARIWRRRAPLLARKQREARARWGRRRQRLYTRSYVMVLLSGALFEVAAGSGFITISIFADRSGRPSLSGLLVALWFLGSVVGGLWFGARAIDRPLTEQYRWSLLALAGSYTLCAVLTGSWALAGGLLIGGLSLAPAFALQYSLIADLTPPAARSEGFTWLQTLTAGGGGLGGALGGPTIDLFDRTAAGFLLAVCCLLVAAVLATSTAMGSRTVRH
jgi:MFS family permease